MKKFILAQILVLCLEMLATRGFAQSANDGKFGGLQLGFGEFSFNTNQYNAVASDGAAHVKTLRTYPEVVAALSVFRVTSKFNIDIGTGGWETQHDAHKNIAPDAESTDGFTLAQSFAYGEINFSYRILGTPRTLVIPSIGIGYMANNIHYDYLNKADSIAQANDNSDDGADYNSHVDVAKNNIYYLNFRLHYLIRAGKDLWWGFQIGYKYSFNENHILYDSRFPASTNHLLNGFYASVIIAL